MCLEPAPFFNPDIPEPSALGVVALFGTFISDSANDFGFRKANTFSKCLGCSLMLLSLRRPVTPWKSLDDDHRTV